MERTTRLIVVIGAVALLAAHLVIGRAWSGMAVTAAAVAFALAACTAWRRRAIAVPLALSCLLPPIVWFTLETFGVQFWILWLAALLGAMLPRLLATNWQSAPRFRAPLVLAALAVIVGAPLVVARELDFNLALLGDMPGAVLSGLPWFSSEWILQVAVTTVTGVLWFDWLCDRAELDIEWHVVAPLTASIAISSAVAVYQMFVEVTFLNATVYGGIGRAAGTMFDANVSGMLAACGAGFAIYLAAGTPRRPLWLLLVPLCLLAVWASGSRTAFAAAACVLLTSGLSWWRHAGRAGSQARRWALVGMGVAVAAGIVAVALTVDTTTVGPLQRFARMLPGRGEQPSVAAAAAELWNRNGYGTAATQLIARYPLAGIGIGSFHLFGPRLSEVGELPPDNAQNWLRHQVVELGVLGALGWIVFAAVLAWFLVARRREGGARLDHVRGVVLAFIVVSLFGMPTQEAVPAMTFWTAAAVLVRYSGDGASHHVRPRSGPVPLGRATLALIALVTLAFAFVTWESAHTRLRVPVRARQFGWPYSYGFYEPEGGPDAGGERWMAGRATALVDVRGPFMRLSVRSPLPDTARQPQRVRAWVEGRQVLDQSIASATASQVTVRMPVGQSQVVVELQVSRTVRPSDLDPSSADNRALGALVHWTFSPKGQ